MGATTHIEWTDSTWNPIRGCSRVSEGCRNCYAEKVAYRFSGARQPYEGLVRINAAGERKAEWNGNVRFVEKHLLDPLKWGPVREEYVGWNEEEQAGEYLELAKPRPRRIFVNSMSDLFHESITDEMRDKIFAVMFACGRHTYQVLTKRSGVMLWYFSADNPRYTARKIVDAAAAMGISDQVFDCDIYFPLPNVWLGVSVEDQKAADERIPLLLQTPAAVRFISAEPLLGPVDLGEHVRPRCANCNTYVKLRGWDGLDEGDDSRAAGLTCGCVYCWHCSDNRGRHERHEPHASDGLHWVIAGGESSREARPMHPDWARSLRDQCQAAGLPFFFKQWGEWLPAMCDGAPGDGQHINASDEPVRTGKNAAGALLDGREWKEFPEGLQ